MQGSERTIWRKLLLFLCTMIALAGLLDGDRLLRNRERRWERDYTTEANRRTWLDWDFNSAMGQVNDHTSTKAITKLMTRFGDVSVEPTRANGDRIFHLHNRQTGDEIDATINNNGVNGEITFAAPLVSHSTAWMIFSTLWRILACAIPTFMLLGFTSLAIPRHLRAWAIAIAACAVIVSLLDPATAGWLTITPWVYAPAATLLIATLAWLIPARQHPAHQCTKCKYDLTGNISGICPECGTPRPLANLATLASNLNQIE